MCTQQEDTQCAGGSRVQSLYCYIMTNAAVHTGAKVTFDEKTQEVMANGKVFKYNLQA
jgi:hypothetical protein